MKAAAQWPRGPVAPTSLAGTGADTEVALTWTAPATTHGTITDYAVEYTPSGGSPTVVLTGSTSESYTVTGLTNDTEYTFRVAAINHTQGEWSDSVAVTPGAVAADPNFSSVVLLAPMDTGFGDVSSNQLVPTINGSPTVVSGNNFGGGYASHSDTSSRIVYDTPSLGAGGWTVEMWYMMAGNSDDLIVFDMGDGSALSPTDGEFIGAFRIGTQIYFYLDNFASNFLITFGLNVWYHLALSGDGQTVWLYLDGVSQGQRSFNSASRTSAKFCLGSRAGRTHVPSRYHNVRLSSVNRYPSGLTFTPPSAPFPTQ